MKKMKYKRLDRRFLPSTTRHSIHLGKDHLVTVQTSSFVYRVNRIFYSEIQAFTCQRTRAYSLITLLLLGLALMCLALVAAGLNGSPLVGDFLGILGMVLGSPVLILLFFHLILGPTCETRLYTAASSYKLPSLGRIWRARPALATLQAQIEQTQGALPAELLLEPDAPDATDDQRRVRPVLLAAGEGRPSFAPAEVELIPGRTRIHDFLYLLMLLLAASLFFDYFQQSSLKNLFDSLLHMGIVCVAFWAAIRQRRMLLPAYLRYYTLGVLGVLILLQYAQGLSVFTFFLGNPTFIADPEYAEIFEQGQIPVALEFTITIQLILFGGMAILGLLLSAVYSLGQGRQTGTVAT